MSRLLSVVPVDAAKAVAAAIAVITAVGCGGGPPAVPVDVNHTTTLLLDQLESQVAAADYQSAEQTADRLQGEGYVAAEQMNRYLRLKTLAEIGSGQFPAAQATIDELARGVDDPAELHILQGQLAAAMGNQTLAKGEFAKAKQLNPQIAIPHSAVLSEISTHR